MGVVHKDLNNFIRDIKVLIVRLEHETDQEESEMIVEEMLYETKKFEGEFCSD